MVSISGSFPSLQWKESTDVDPVEVVGTEGCVALGALTLPGVIACFDTLEAEDVEALCEHCILLAHVTAWAGQTGLQDKHYSEGPWHCPWCAKMMEGEGPSIPCNKWVVSLMQDRATVPQYRQEMSNTKNVATQPFD